MPTAHIDRDVSIAEAETVLTRELGPAYQVRRTSNGLTVKRGGLLWANVRATQADGGTTFRVHGGGLILNRLYSEVALARKVSDALSRSLSSGSTAN
jgi:hypothetical protein